MSRDFLFGVIVGVASGMAPELARAIKDSRSDPSAVQTYVMGFAVFALVVILLGAMAKGKM